MYKIIGNLLLLALFVSASAFTTTASAPTATQNHTNLNVGKKSILSLTASQLFSQSITASWTATGAGPFVVRLHGANGGVLQVIFTGAFTHTFIKLPVGNSYRVSVQDVTGTIWISDLVPVTY